MTEGSPNVRRRILGKRTRELREAAGLTLDDAASLVLKSKAALGKFENGLVAPKAAEVAYMLICYGVEDPAIRDPLLSLAARKATRVWWQDYRDVVTPETAEYVTVEAEADRIRSCALLHVPGLLQTPGYARSLMTAASLPGPSAEQSARYVEFRTARQHILEGDEARLFHVILSEAVLRSGLGGHDVMRTQLNALVQRAAQPNVSLQILPLSATENPAIDGSFTLYDVLGGAFSVVLLDHLCDSMFVEDEAKVARYSLVFGRLAELSLDEPASLALLEEAAADSR